MPVEIAEAVALEAGVPAVVAIAILLYRSYKIYKIAKKSKMGIQIRIYRKSEKLHKEISEDRQFDKKHREWLLKTEQTIRAIAMHDTFDRINQGKYTYLTEGETLVHIQKLIDQQSIAQPPERDRGFVGDIIHDYLNEKGSIDKFIGREASEDFEIDPFHGYMKILIGFDRAARRDTLEDIWHTELQEEFPIIHSTYKKKGYLEEYD